MPHALAIAAIVPDRVERVDAVANPVVDGFQSENPVLDSVLEDPAGFAEFVEAAVAAGLNVIVAGGTQAGKTTLLNCLAAAIPPRERVVTCEEVFELADGNIARVVRGEKIGTLVNATG